MNLRLPAFLAQHPAESLIAVGLLLGLLFISADGNTPRPGASQALQAAAEKN